MRMRELAAGTGMEFARVEPMRLAGKTSHFMVSLPVASASWPSRKRMEMVLPTGTS